VSAAELYVYYRIMPAHAEAARAAFQRARGASGVRLLQRSDAAAEALTWMEVYATPEQQALEPGIAAALAAFVQGERHSERFAALLA